MFILWFYHESLGVQFRKFESIAELNMHYSDYLNGTNSEFRAFSVGRHYSKELSLREVVIKREWVLD